MKYRLRQRPGAAMLPLALLASAASAQPGPAPGKLAFERLALHQYEDGPVLAGTYEFVPGETAWFSCRIKGFQVEQKADNRHVKLAWQMDVLDPAGVPIEKTRSGRIEEMLVPEDKTWQAKFLASFEIPPFAPGGSYRVPVKVKDEITGSEIAGQFEFNVRGPSVEPAESLVIHNFHFLQTETDTTAFRPAIYHPGGTLWARFDIAGYKFGENNRYSVYYGLAILSVPPDGGEPKQLFEQPEAASESKESFYPQRVVPGALSLNLDPNVAIGSYILAVKVHDKLGGEDVEFREGFQVQR